MAGNPTESGHDDLNYVAPGWLPGGQLQTIWPALYSRRVLGLPIPYRRERWTTPDADFVDVDYLDDGAPRGVRRPLLVVFHGLEGSSRSHYSEAFAAVARERGWACALPHFRGCSGEINRAPRAYHSGDHGEIGWMLERLRGDHQGPLMAVGVSLGGNALLRWAAQAGAQACRSVDSVAAVCSPLDLAAGGRAIGRGFNRQVYTRMFMRTLIPKALQKLAQYPGLFDRDTLLRARDLYAFDNVFTAPLHGFKDAEDYWRRAAAKPLLRCIRISALVVNARNDPFVPAASLPVASEAGSYVHLWQPLHGGHVGFAQGRMPGHVLAMPNMVATWLVQHAVAAPGSGIGLNGAQSAYG
jgi:predicted alpha/beta-fold hydrolase